MSTVTTGTLVRLVKAPAKTVIAERTFEAWKAGLNLVVDPKEGTIGRVLEVRSSGLVTVSIHHGDYRLDLPQECFEQLTVDSPT